MNKVDEEACSTSPTPTAVYLLQRKDGIRFKIGVAIEPLRRVQQLPEFAADDLDLSGSLAAWLPSPARAYEFESALHRGLAAWKTSPGHALDGHTEWFLPPAYRAAVQLIRQMPVSAEYILPPAIVSLLSDPGLQPNGAETSPEVLVMYVAQDVLWRMEDLLLRVAGLCKVSTAVVGEVHCVRLHDLRKVRWGNLELLRWQLLDLDRYHWKAAAQDGSFVKLMVYEADDLVLHLTPMRQVRRWAAGALVPQLMALLERLEKVPPPKRGSRN